MMETEWLTYADICIGSGADESDWRTVYCLHDNEQDARAAAFEFCHEHGVTVRIAQVVGAICREYNPHNCPF